MIPANRPVIGKDIEALRQKFGYTVEDMSWLLGIAMPGWSRIVKQRPEEPLRDVTLALIVRYLDKYWERGYMPVFSTPEEIMNMIKADPKLVKDIGGSVPLKKMGILVGRDSSAGHRWNRSRRGISPAITRASLLIKRLIEEKGSVKDWVEIINTESQARGVPDVWQLGKWKMPTSMVVKDVAAANDE
jgi:hypothetical protein